MTKLRKWTVKKHVYYCGVEVQEEARESTVGSYMLFRAFYP